MFTAAKAQPLKYCQIKRKLVEFALPSWYMTHFNLFHEEYLETFLEKLQCKTGFYNLHFLV